MPRRHASRVIVCSRCSEAGHNARECCTRFRFYRLPGNGACAADLNNVTAVYTNDANSATKEVPAGLRVPTLLGNYDVTWAVLSYLTWGELMGLAGVTAEFHAVLSRLFDAFVVGNTLFERPRSSLPLDDGGRLVPLGFIESTVLRLRSHTESGAVARLKTFFKDAWRNALVLEQAEAAAPVSETRTDGDEAPMRLRPLSLPLVDGFFFTKTSSQVTVSRQLKLGRVHDYFVQSIVLVPASRRGLQVILTHMEQVKPDDDLALFGLETRVRSFITLGALDELPENDLLLADSVRVRSSRSPRCC